MTTDPTPQPKVVAATLGAALTTIVLFIVTVAFPGLVIPTGVEGALATVMAFTLGYVVSNK